MIETKGHKVKIIKVSQLKYLGFGISEDASNVAKISEIKPLRKNMNLFIFWLLGY